MLATDSGSRPQAHSDYQAGRPDQAHGRWSAGTLNAAESRDCLASKSMELHVGFQVWQKAD